MARTTNEIMNTMLEAVKANTILSALSASASAIWRLFLFIISDAHSKHEQIFDQHKKDVNEIVITKTVHKPNWHAYMAKRFQFGYSLINETDLYDNSVLTDEQIQNSLIVKYAAAVPSRDKSILYIKVAGDRNGQRIQLSNNQIIALTAFLEDVSPAGVYFEIINAPADDIRLKIDVYYDALIFDTEGKRLDGTGDNVIQDAIRTYLSTLQFNGTYTNQGLIDALQKIEGVQIAELKEVSSRYGVYVEYTKIDAKEIAYSGYYQISDNNLTLRFIKNEELL